MRRNGFTVIELLVVLAIIAIFIALLAPALGGLSSRYYSTKNSIKAKVVRKYEVNQGNGNALRIDYKIENSASIDTAIVQNNTWLRFYGADTIYANLEDGKSYQLDLVGYRDEYWEYFPNIIGMAPLQ